MLAEKPNIIPFPRFDNTWKISDGFKDDKIQLLETELIQLRQELALERRRCYNLERETEELRSKLTELENSPPKKRIRKTEAELTAAEPKEYSEFKSDGKRKARPADSVRSYEDFKAVQDYFLSRGKIRDWMLWTVGVSLGLRISDLLSLKIKHVLNQDLNFRENIFVVEQKTSKLNKLLITESVVDALTKYFDSIGWNIKPEDYVFVSEKTKTKMTEEYGWKILSNAGKALNLPINMGSHTMRKTHANVMLCTATSGIDMNTMETIRASLNHSDIRITMRYLGSYRTLLDKARTTVSDFVLGKSDVHELIAGNDNAIAAVLAKLDEIWEKLCGITADKQNKGEPQ
jgi:integrase